MTGWELVVGLTALGAVVGVGAAEASRRLRPDDDLESVLDVIESGVVAPDERPQPDASGHQDQAQAVREHEKRLVAVLMGCEPEARRLASFVLPVDPLLFRQRWMGALAARLLEGGSVGRDELPRAVRRRLDDRDVAAARSEMEAATAADDPDDAAEALARLPWIAELAEDQQRRLERGDWKPRLLSAAQIWVAAAVLGAAAGGGHGGWLAATGAAEGASPTALGAAALFIASFVAGVAGCGVAAHRRGRITRRALWAWMLASGVAASVATALAGVGDGSDAAAVVILGGVVALVMAFARRWWPGRFGHWAVELRLRHVDALDADDEPGAWMSHAAALMPRAKLSVDDHDHTVRLDEVSRRTARRLARLARTRFGDELVDARVRSLATNVRWAGLVAVIGGLMLAAPPLGDRLADAMLWVLFLMLPAPVIAVAVASWTRLSVPVSLLGLGVVVPASCWLAAAGVQP